MSIIRTKKDREYFAVSNEPFNDERLSWEARGMMGYLLSKPDGWIVRNSDLQKQTNANKYKVQRIVNELKVAGYIRRFREQDEDGHLRWVTEVYERCDLNPEWGEIPEGLISRPSGKPSPKNLTIRKPGHIESTDSIASTDNSNGRYRGPAWNIPDGLKGETLEKAWFRWFMHYREMTGKNLSSFQGDLILADLEQLGEARAVAAIDYSIKRGWKSIHEEDGATIAPKKKQPKTVKIATPDGVKEVKNG